jgi:hypothetical protein
VSATYATADGTATAGKDYTAETGTVTFAPGQTSRMILLSTHYDSTIDNPASSFSLPGGKNGDPNPQDIVTDGTSFWVVDGTKFKVFKYTLSGSLLGSWSIDPAITAPTGITINPNNVSDIWIVDSGSLRIYDFTAAAGRTSGSQNAAAFFVPAAGEYNPQGIADPPPADLPLTPAAAPPAPSQPSAPASGGVSAVPSLTPRDEVFSTLLRESVRMPTERAIDLLAGAALTAHADSPLPVADRAWTPGGASGGEKPLDRAAPLTSGISQEFGSDRGDGDLRDDTLADEASQAATAVEDFFSAGLANDAAAEE